MAYGYPVLPIVGVEVYKQDIVVLRDGGPGPAHDHERRDITTFSAHSRKRLAFVASNTDIHFTSMLTLTYPREFPSDGAMVKRHFHDFLVYLRRKVSKISYLWFLEFQRRGAPHIHVLLRGVRVSRQMQGWCSSTWYNVVGSNDMRHLAAGTRLERIRKEHGARNYAVKYAFKMKQKMVPAAYQNVGRFWGNSRDVKPVVKGEVVLRNDDLVGCLEAAQWGYLRGSVIEWRVLYGAAESLTKHMPHGMLGLSTSNSGQSDSEQLCTQQGE